MCMKVSYTQCTFINLVRISMHTDVHFKRVLCAAICQYQALLLATWIARLSTKQYLTGLWLVAIEMPLTHIR
jgi:hypothetical protein